jgi:hypothetical protein
VLSMSWNYRAGAIVTFTRDDGTYGPGQIRTFLAAEGWKVEIQDQGCVEITQYGVPDGESAHVFPWHRIWQITCP